MKTAWKRWLLPAAPCAALAAVLPDPHLLSVRDWATPALFLLSLAGLTAAWTRQVRWQGWSIALAWLAVLGLVLVGVAEQHLHKLAVLNTADQAPARMAALGEHMVVGYEDIDQVRELARRGLIGGLFITRRNVEGKLLEQVRAELAGIQALRRQAGLPPLMLSTDQEGGPVSRLSPLVPQQPTLASVLGPGISPQQIEQRARAYGEQQAKGLADLGINANFSPVVDLKPAHPAAALDFHTRIADRAIAEQADTVTRVALAYSQALHANGVMPTLKHFPGLGRVKQDSHHFTARLETSTAILDASDWQPFRRILAQTPAMLMVGHVIVEALDPTRPASLSQRVLTGLVRETWGFDGVLITDDMTMAAVYDRGLCQASAEALNAGVDLLLFAYDWEKYYLAMDCLAQAQADGKLVALDASRQRLARLPWRNGADAGRISGGPSESKLHGGHQW
jgi:beta-N-acetylhexosaminidase